MLYFIGVFRNGWQCGTRKESGRYGGKMASMPGLWEQDPREAAAGYGA